MTSDQFVRLVRALENLDGKIDELLKRLPEKPVWMGIDLANPITPSLVPCDCVGPCKIMTGHKVRWNEYCKTAFADTSDDIRERRAPRCIRCGLEMANVSFGAYQCKNEKCFNFCSSCGSELITSIGGPTTCSNGSCTSHEVRV